MDDWRFDSPYSACLLLLPILMSSCLRYNADVESCESNEDCKQYFELCSSGQCIKENALCYWVKPNGETTSKYKVNSSQPVIGVLAGPAEVKSSSLDRDIPDSDSTTENEDGLTPSALLSESSLAVESQYLESEAKTLI